MSQTSRIRTPLAVLNELSLPSPADRFSDQDLIDGFGQLVAVLRASRRVRRELAVVSGGPIASHAVAEDGRSLGAVMGSQGGRARDQWRYFQTLRNHAPFTAAPSLTMVVDSEEYHHNGVPAQALGLAAANRQMAVSWRGDHWAEHLVAVVRSILEEFDSGELGMSEETVEVVHSSEPDHVVIHEEFLRRVALPEPFSGEEIWQDRAELFPSIRFLPRVEAQLSSMDAGGAKFRAVLNRLEELDTAVRSWTSGPRPEWKTKVTPEGEEGKKHCWFRDEDGSNDCYETHARFTPGAGRIHLRVIGDPPSASIVIGHIGTKLYG